jgi:glycosyltransferase involved in cell wall biosynthesis
MEIALLEPFYAGSHASWAQEYAARSRNQVKILSLKGQYWKWRMHGGAVTLAREFLAAGYRPDLLLASDMLDLTTFLALTREVTAAIPVALYMHENQLSYPWSPDDADPDLQRDMHYSFINYSSALCADAVLFNSDYHRCDFLSELPAFLKTFPDCNEIDSVQQVADKSRTLYLGLDLRKFDQYRPTEERQVGQPPLILWNHRWEYDKNPDEFFRVLFALEEQGVAFELAVLGEGYRKQPTIFAEARQRLDQQIIHWGYAESFADYAAWLWRADILPVTSIHDFFGISVVQAIYCNLVMH